MVRRSTWILLLVFAVLVVFALVFPRFLANRAQNQVTTTPTVAAANLYDLAINQVKDITITANAGDKIDLYIDPNSLNWAITGIPADEANSFQIESILNQLLSLQVKDTIAELPSLDPVGLSNPAYTITMTTTDGTQVVTSVGEPNAIGSGYYVIVGSAPVVIVDKVIMDDVLSMINEPPLNPTATPEATTTGTAAPLENTVQVTPTP